MTKQSGGDPNKRYLTGLHAIEEALKSGKGRELLLSDRGPRARRLQEITRRTHVSVRFVPKDTLRSLAGSEARFAALLVDPNELAPSADLDTIIGEVHGAAVTVILDGVTDPHNVGAVLRSADQLGAAAVIVPERRAAGDTETVHRVSAGAASYVPLIRVTNTTAAVDRLRRAGFWIYGADLDGLPLPKAEFSEKACIVLGSEGRGLRPGLRNACDQILTIPSHGHVDSLNVSVACGTVLYAWTLRRI